jgi:hypothetical protein
VLPGEIDDPPQPRSALQQPLDVGGGAHRRVTTGMWLYRGLACGPVTCRARTILVTGVVLCQFAPHALSVLTSRTVFALAAAELGMALSFLPPDPAG